MNYSYFFFFFYLSWCYVKVNALTYLSLFSVSFYKDEWWPCLHGQVDFWTPVIGYFRTFFLNRAAFFFFFFNLLSILELSIGSITLALLLWEWLRKNQLLKRIIFSGFFSSFILKTLHTSPSFLFLFASEICFTGWPVDMHSISFSRIPGIFISLSQIGTLRYQRQ